MSDSIRPARVSLDQLKRMVDFMGQHVEFASGTLRTLEARHMSKKLWRDLAKILNNCRGIRKTADGWSKYWSDFKNKLKNKLIVIKRKKSGLLNKNINPLTKLEKRTLVILGPQFGNGKSRFDEYTDPIPVRLPAEVKQETHQENSINYFDIAHNMSNDILLSDRECDASRESSADEYVEETDQNRNKNNIFQNVYPKWLIEVEKKRVDAELLRAKAEAQRAIAAAKTAEAAVIQAEALRRLSAAADKQAGALLRIAEVLESNGSREES